MFHEGSDGALNGRGAYQNVDATVVAAHAVNGGVELLEIRDVGANAQGVAAGMLNLQMRPIQLRLAAGQQSHLGSSGSESEGQPFADATSSARDQHTRVRQ